MLLRLSLYKIVGAEIKVIKSESHIIARDWKLKIITTKYDGNITSCNSLVYCVQSAMDGYSFFYKVRQGLLQIATGITRSTIELLQIARRALRSVMDILNNYWMRLSMISWIIKTEVCVRLRQIIQTRSFDNSRYHAKTEFNNCFIIHFLPNRQKKTFSHSVSEENTPRGLVTRQTLNLTW